jgi:hypothetical protein
MVCVVSNGDMSMKCKVVRHDRRRCDCFMSMPYMVISFLALAPCAIGGNVAINKPATASRTYSTYLPALAVDGNAGTYWNGATAPQWLKVDLQRSIPLQRVVLISPGGSHVYNLLGSLDDTNWTHVATGLVVTTTTPVPIVLAGQSFRYLKCDVVGGGDWTSLAELEAYPAVEIEDIAAASGIVQLTLTNCLSDVTNVVERAFDLAAPSPWEQLTNLIGLTDSTVWQGSVSSEWENVFYRIKSK